MRDLFY